MKVLMMACSKQANQVMQRLKERWIEEEPDTQIICKVKCKALAEISEKMSVSECVKPYFQEVDAIIFLAATGIAVRSIAGCLEHKAKDPAVLVMDEKGKFCISLLSGHAGGANALTEKISKWMGAIPVVTTATDIEGKFAVDDFARIHHLVITDWKMAKEISVAVLEGQKIGMMRDGFLEEKVQKESFVLPKEVHYYEKEQEKDSVLEAYGIQISYKNKIKKAFQHTLQLIPKDLIIGIGCRKNMGKEKIMQAITTCCLEENICEEAICEIASIDLKKKEVGILEYCKEKQVPFITFSSEQLSVLEGCFSESDFVEQVTGVSNVCERSAVAAGGKLLISKKIYDGVTLAIARKDA